MFRCCFLFCLFLQLVLTSSDDCSFYGDSSFSFESQYSADLGDLNLVVSNPFNGDLIIHESSDNTFSFFIKSDASQDPFFQVDFDDGSPPGTISLTVVESDAPLVSSSSQSQGLLFNLLSMVMWWKGGDSLLTNFMAKQAPDCPVDILVSIPGDIAHLTTLDASIVGDIVCNFPRQVCQIPSTTSSMQLPTSADRECFDGVDNNDDELSDFDDFGCFGPNGQESTSNYGWTLFYPPPDAKVIYCSSSDGNDTNDGLTPNTAVKSIDKGFSLLDDRSGDWLLLKRGDIWRDERLGPFDGWNDKSGKSESEMLLYSSYGFEPQRPKIINGGFHNRQGWEEDPVVANQSRQDFVAIKGLEFYIESKDPKSRGFAAKGAGAINRLAPGESFLLEDVFANYGSMSFDIGGEGLFDFTVRRSVIANAYSSDSGHAHGFVYQDEDLLSHDQSTLLKG